MKITFKTMLFALAFMTFFMSCNNEELFIEEPITQVIDDSTIPDDTNPTVSVASTTPCDFKLTDVTANTTVIINCIMDLGGQTITLPAGVTLVYEGGDIINGTINFSSSSVISGELLNTSLTLGGSTPQMKDPTFNFNPQRWGIVEGITTSEIALNNRDILEGMLNKTKEMGTTTFKIDKIDAYFEVSLVTSGTTNQNFYASVEAINVPSNFNLVMTENTHLRVQPNSRKTYALMSIRDASNVNISGGILHGDRDEHDYSDGGTHEWGYLFFMRGAVDSSVSNMTMKNSSGDGMKIQCINFTFQDNYKPSHDVIVSNCIFDNNRRNNMSITGGYNLYIDNNQFLNASKNTAKSKGIAPGFALDVEAVRARDTNGDLVFYERAEDIFITNNIEKNSRIGGFTVAIGYDVTLENNTVETGISFSLAHGTKIINNTLISSSNSGTGIKAGRTNADDATIYNNEVYGNSIKGFGTGIMVSNKDVTVYNNDIEDCLIGVTLIGLTNGTIENNTISSNLEGSLGITIGTTYANGVIIKGNNINVKRNPLKFNKTNSEPDYLNYEVTVSNNILRNGDQSSTFINGSNGFVFNNNSLDHGFELFDSNNITLANNVINTVNDHGFDLRLVNTNITISNNTIDVSVNKQCVNIDNTTNTSEVTVMNNSCQ
jgi:hypothetical protein